MVSAKELYRSLRSVLGPTLKAAGFAALKGAQLGWTRATPAGHTCLWFQCSKWGWMEDWGSTFTLEFQNVSNIADLYSLSGRRQRIGFLLEGFPELEEMRLLNNRIISALPGTRSNQVVRGVLPDGSTYAAIGFLEDPEPAVYARDIWLNYHGSEDVTAWSRFFDERIVKFVELFEDNVQSPQALARARFDEMMGRVQSATGLPAKVALLETFATTEADAHFREVARTWLVDLQGMAR